MAETEGSYELSQMENYVETMFEIRRKHESRMTDQQLVEFDYDFSNYFTPEVLREMVG